MDSYINNIKKLSVRPTTFDSVLITADQIKQRIGHYGIKDITSEIIQVALINKMYEEEYAYSTIHKAYILLNECLNYAVSKDYIIKNPCVGVKMPNKENFTNKNIRFLTDEEIEIFRTQANSMLKTIKVPKYIHGNILCLILYTGLRISELCALKWSDVDLKRRTLNISKTIVVVYKHSGDSKERTVTLQNTTKSGKPRVVPLNAKALEILERQREYVGGSDDDFIVTGSDIIPDKTVVANSYTKIAKAAKISNPSGVHTLRHTFASLAIRKGVNIKVVSDILGHASTNFTYNTYVHILDEQKYDAVDLLEDL